MFIRTANQQREQQLLLILRTTHTLRFASQNELLIAMNLQKASSAALRSAAPYSVSFPETIVFSMGPNSPMKFLSLILRLLLHFITISF